MKKNPQLLAWLATFEVEAMAWSLVAAGRFLSKSEDAAEAFPPRVETFVWMGQKDIVWESFVVVVFFCCVGRKSEFLICVF